MKEDRPRGIRVRECGKVRSSDQDREGRRARDEGQTHSLGRRAAENLEWKVEKEWTWGLRGHKGGRDEGGVGKKRRKREACVRELGRKRTGPRGD